MMFGKTAQWAYIVSRVRVMKRSLIPSDEFTKMMNMDFNEVVRYLEETGYKQEIDEFSYRYTGPQLIDYAISTNLFRIYSRIVDVSFGLAKELIMEYLKKWDIWNTTNIIRGKISNASNEQIEETLVPVGEFSQEFFKSLLAKDLDEITKSFEGTPYSEPLSRLTPDNIAEIEDELYRIYYSRLVSMRPSEQALKLFIDFVKMEIDVKNIKAILRLTLEEESAEDIMGRIIPGGYQLDADEARKLSAMDWDELTKSLEGYWFWKGIEAVEDFARLEINLDKAWLKAVAGKANKYPLSILPVLHYMNLKKIEADNLRIIGWGKWEDLSNEAVEEQLVVL